MIRAYWMRRYRLASSLKVVIRDSMSKVGRNEPCPCGGGKKYKKCHGKTTEHPPNAVPPVPFAPPFSVRKLQPHEVPPELAERMMQVRRADRSFTQQFGRVRPPISVEHEGYRFVAAGNKLLYQPAKRAQFFTDILFTLLQNTFGKEWWAQEVAKPRGTRHPIFEARYKAMTHMKAQPKDERGVYKFQMTGPILSYLSFAYDLFVVQDNARLDPRLLERLKNSEMFQGARHELFAEATCLRAGFEIEHEDETDGSMRHAEFTATHRTTGQKVSVEAKSKHRPGVLGQPGLREKDGEYNLPVGKLLNLAIAKKPPYPLVVFLDLNLPWGAAQHLLEVNPPAPPHPFIHRTLDRIRRKHGGHDPINLLIVTNQPQHYTVDDGVAHTAQILSIQTQVPSMLVVRPDALLLIHSAANMYGRIPQFFDGKAPS
jgi:hypothetical protein